MAIAYPFALTSVLFSFDSVIDQMFYDQFEKVQLYDLKVSLAQYVPYDDAVHAAEQLDHVKSQLTHTHTSGVLSLTDSARILKGYRELMTRIIAMVNLFTLMAIATGIILITNISVISIRERRSEFGTLAILGADLREISEIVRFVN